MRHRPAFRRNIQTQVFFQSLLRPDRLIVFHSQEIFVYREQFPTGCLHLRTDKDIIFLALHLLLKRGIL